MPDTENLRPLETVILKLRAEGLDSSEIGTRLGKKPGTINRILEMIDHKSDLPEQQSTGTAENTAVERVIDRLREDGETYGQIGNRLNMSGERVKDIESYSKMRPDGGSA